MLCDDEIGTPKKLAAYDLVRVSCNVWSRATVPMQPYKAEEGRGLDVFSTQGLFIFRRFNDSTNDTFNPAKKKVQYQHVTTLKIDSNRLVIKMVVTISLLDESAY